MSSYARTLCLVLGVAMVGLTLPCARAQGVLHPAATTVAQDSLLLSDSLGSHKTPKVEVPLYTPLRELGSIMMRAEQNPYTVERADIQHEFYTSLDEILLRRLPMLPLNQGFYGMPNSMRVLGGSARDNAVLFDGHAMNDVGSAMPWISAVATEFMQRCEVLLGSEAVILADNASGMALNIQQPRYNAKSPYTRLWYSEGAYGFISSDGVFSQNIAPNLNMTLGYRREAGDGRYTNQAVDSWNLRALLRWNMSARTNVSFVEQFTNRYVGLNGGVDPASSPDVNNELSAQVRFPLLNERVVRHDLSLTLRSLLSDDSTTQLQLGAYYSHAAWHLGRDTTLIFTTDSALGVDWANSRVGLSGFLEQDLLEHLQLRVGGDLEYQRSDSSDYLQSFSRARLAAFGQARLLVSTAMSISGGLRLQTLGTKATLAAGARLDWQLSQEYRLLVDASQSARLPSAAEDLNLNQEHTTLLYAEIRRVSESAQFSLLGYSRYTTSPILATPIWNSDATRMLGAGFSNGDALRVTGAVLRGSWMPGSWRVHAMLESGVAQRGSVSEQLYPSLYAQAGVEYNYTLGKNVLSLGAEVGGHSGYTGEGFVPQNWSYITAQNPQNAAFSGLDIVAGAKIGDAFLKICYQNILSNSSSSLSTFPAVVRNLSLSIAWTFFD